MDPAYLTLSTETLKIDLSGPANYTYNVILYNPTRDLVAFKVMESGSSYLDINPLYGQIMPKEETVLAISCNRESVRTLFSKFIISSFLLHEENLKKAMRFDNPWDHRILLGIQSNTVEVVFCFNFQNNEDAGHGFSLAQTDLEDKKQIQKQIDDIEKNRQIYAQLAGTHENLEIETFLHSQKLKEKSSELARDEQELNTIEEEANKFANAINNYHMLLDIYKGETDAISKLKAEAILQTEFRLFTSISALESAKDRFKSSKPSEITEICCTVCLNNSIDVIIYPCKHVCVCHVCVAPLEMCPICRCKIKKYDTVYIQTGI